VVARLKPSEPKLDRGAVDGQLASIDLASFANELPYPIATGAYGQLASEDPAVQPMPTPFPKPATEEGTHLSYSLQWFAFGVLMFIGFGYAARQQARNAAIDAEEDERDVEEIIAANAPPKRRPASNRKNKRPTSEEEEDAILDAQGF
jgi:cytochrome oxidase assembly protein ShyY1